MPNIDHVDLFLGNGEVDTPVPQGVAAAWNWLKAQVGNTHPGACSPFGMVSAGAYSGAYPTGYGLYAPSTHGPVPKMFDHKTATGFTHFHHSGTGFIGRFYNYYRVIPTTAGHEEALAERRRLIDETARPGYYAAGLADTGIRAELTVHGKVAGHRYTFPAAGRLIIDVGDIGLAHPACREQAGQVSLQFLDETTAAAQLVVEGCPVYAAIALPGRTSLWRGKEVLEDRRLALSGDAVEPCGFCIELPGTQAELRFGFSFRSVEQAQANLAAVKDRGFDEIAAQSFAAWQEVLERITIRTASEQTKTIFYSALYHSLIKPIKAPDESPWWSADTPFFTDFVTMWDMYKTQLPLVFTLCPDVGKEIVASMLETMATHGEFPIAYLLSDNFVHCRKQAAALVHHSLYDAWRRGIEGDWERAARLMDETFTAASGAEFVANGVCRPYTQTLDLAQAAHATAELAAAVGEVDVARRMRSLAPNWIHAFDPETGRLKTDSEFYEGSHWNYSFRAMADMPARIGLYPSTAAFVDDLDRFFGFHDIANGTIDPHPEPASWRREIRHDIFEGLNNESDMETPYTYVFAGRHDRTAEILRAIMTFQFAVGDGGLPGNEDSGGLSSWYVWTAIGLFPISGQDLLVIGSPIVDEARLAVGNGEFVIRAESNSAVNIHPQRVILNGRELDRIWLRPAELQAGGTLVLEMGPQPRAWPAP